MAPMVTGKRLPGRLWHRVHLLSLPMIVMVTVHGFLAGSDRGERALQWSAFSVVVGVVLLLALRLI